MPYFYAGAAVTFIGASTFTLLSGQRHIDFFGESLTISNIKTADSVVFDLQFTPFEND
jgi:hypothetical protein